MKTKELVFLMALTLSCANNRCSPTAPEEDSGSAFEIAYHREDRSNSALHAKLHVINVETGKYRVLDEMDAGSPLVWRKEPNEIFHIRSQASTNNFELRASGSDGSYTRAVATLPFAPKNISFSKDGSRIAVAGSAQGFFLIDAASGGAASVARSKVMHIEFSPTVDHLAALFEDSNAVYLLNLVGDIEKRFGLAFVPDRLKWSPDGNKISCWKIGRSTAAIVNITNPFPKPCPDCGDLAWSPDGKEMIFSDIHTNLGKMNADCANKILLGTTGSEAQWSPNGMHLAFIEQTGSEHWLIVSEAQGMNRKSLAPLHSRSFAWRPL